MTLRLTVDAPSLTTAERETFQGDARLVFQIIGHIRANCGTPASKTTAVLADDFTAAVEHFYRPFPEQEKVSGWYEARRAGGRAVAKTLQQADDASEVVIVFDSSTWQGVEDALCRAETIQTLAHEFTHVVSARARYASGVMAGVVLPSQTGHEVARSLSRTFADEYRADRVLGTVIAAMIRDADGNAIDGFPWRVASDGWISTVRAILDDAHPGWPDLVDDYRNYRMPLMEMWQKFVASFEHAVTLIVHAQAAADSADAGDFLEMSPIDGLAATKLYLGPVKEFLTEVRSQPPLPRQREVATIERSIVDTGERAFLTVWKTLGLTPEERANRQWALWVSEPTR